jgi:thiol-disulfide isomerase/thioredoxin
MAPRKATQKHRGRARGSRGQMTRKRGSAGAGKFLRVDSAKDIPNFESMLKKGPLTIIMVYLGWCGHCKKAEPTFREVAQNNYPGVNFAMLNGDLQDQTSIKSVKVEGVPEFVVSVPNKANQGNTSVKVPISYDKNTVERLATVSANTVKAAGSGNFDPSSINSSMTSGSPKPPPFLAINAPKAAAHKPEEEMNITAVSGEEDDSDELEFGGMESHPTSGREFGKMESHSTSNNTMEPEKATTLKMNSVVPPPSASLVAHARRERKRQNLLTPAITLSDEPNIISPIHSTSPKAATAHLNKEVALADASLKKPMMIGGAGTFARRSVSDLTPVTVDGYQLTAQKVVTGTTLGGKKEKIEYSYTVTYTDNKGKVRTKKVKDTDIIRLVGKIRAASA